MLNSSTVQATARHWSYRATIKLQVTNSVYFCCEYSQTHQSEQQVSRSSMYSWAPKVFGHNKYKSTEIADSGRK